jgi:hypothetical protein
LPQVTAADLQFPNEDGEISVSDDDDDDPNGEDYTDHTRTNLEHTLNQEHTITAVLGITYVANAMATQEKQILAEEDNDGAIDVQVNETEGVDNPILTTRSECYKKRTKITQAPTVKPPPIVPSNITRPLIVTPPPIAPRNRNKTVT